MVFLTRSSCPRSALITGRVSLPSTSLRFLAGMAPKVKRKATEEGLPTTKRVKKTDTVGSQMSVASTAASEIGLPGQPTNTQLPDEISFAERIPGTRRISAWNVCSWAASHKKVGFRHTTRYLGDLLIVGHFRALPGMSKRRMLTFWCLLRLRSAHPHYLVSPLTIV